jgi:hypothetical protein
LIGVSSEDPKGNRSLLFSFPLFINQPSVVRVSGVFLAPTIAVDKTEVKRGDTLAITGYAYPESEVTIGVSSENETFYKTKASTAGFYFHNLDTSILEIGNHTTRAKAALSEEFSSFTETIGFLVGNKNVLARTSEKVFKGDTNNDKRVNLVDFSVMAYWYKRTRPPVSADLNGDGKVDLVDFSILAFNWTG